MAKGFLLPFLGRGRDMVQRIRDFHIAMVQARELPQKWADFFTKIYGTNEKSIAYEWQPKTLPAWMETLHTKDMKTNTKMRVRGRPIFMRGG
jgi:hypothetical protein